MELDAHSSKPNTMLVKIIKDLTEEKQNTPFWASPLLTFTWKDKVNEIIGI